jgi:hypothetical protein
MRQGLSSPALRHSGLRDFGRTNTPASSLESTSAVSFVLSASNPATGILGQATLQAGHPLRSQDRSVYAQMPGSNPVSGRHCRILDLWVEDFGSPSVGPCSFCLLTGVIDALER